MIGPGTSSVASSSFVVTVAKREAPPSQAPSILNNEKRYQGDHNNVRDPPLKFSFLIPLISAGAIMWAMHRNKKLCCTDCTGIEEVGIPSEIVLDDAHSSITKCQMRHKTILNDIELQSVDPKEPTTSPIAPPSTSQKADWIDDFSDQKDTSFSWMEVSSSAKYQYLND